MDAELLKILCCPETHQKLQLASPEQLEKFNTQIVAGKLQNRAGRVVQEKMDGGLIRADGRFLYPVRGSVPVMLIDDAIPLN